MKKSIIYIIIALFTLTCFLSCKVSPTVEKVEVLFISDDSIVASIEVEKGGMVYAPQIPQKEGLFHDGWKKEGTEELFDFSLPINEDVILYAVWERIELSVRFENLEEEADVSHRSVYYGDQIEKPLDPIREGYIFIGW